MAASQAPLQISCLGKTQICYLGEELSGSLLKKAQALLIYLALEPGHQEREALAALLWSDMPGSRARANLRTALSRLGRQLGQYLHTTRQTAAFEPSPGVWLDVLQFQAGLASDSLQKRRDALTLYKGDFLEGFAVRNAPVFEEWALVRREQLRDLALEGLSRQSEEALQTGDYSLAMKDLRRLLVLDPWQEAAHRSLMRALAASGDRAAALAQFEVCRQTLLEELDVAPAPATVALYEQIKAGELTTEDRTLTIIRSPGHNLPALTTPFVGRQAELAQIAELLADPGCRLLTLHGPGGIGKTRLALQAGRQALGAFANGVYLVPLETVDSVDRMATAIAKALDVPLSGRREPRAELLAYLRERELLLILDNLEHLLEGTDLLVEILEDASDIKLVVTSREVLNLYEEWLLEVKGLPYPMDEGAADPAQFDSVALFLQRARQVRAGFELTNNRAAVFEICHLLMGMPLGIELAAAWVRNVSPTQIARQIATNLHELATSLRNMPARHRSMVAVFDHSWNLLSPDEKRLFRQLSVFRGGFTEDAAHKVAGASRSALSSLADKALLQPGSGKRYDVHPLIRHYTAEKLATHPDEEARTRERHAAYFAAFLAEQEAAVTRPEQQDAFQRIAGEIDNVRAAWTVAVTSGQSDTVDQMAEPLFHFYRKRGFQHDGAQQFAMAADSLRGSAPPPLLARLLIRQGRLSEHISGDFDQPSALLTEGLALARKHDMLLDAALALAGLGMLALMQGQPGKSEPYLQESLDIYRQADVRWGAAGVLTLLAWLYSAQGEGEQAKAVCQEAIAIHRETGDTTGLAAALTALGNIYAVLGEPAPAEEAYAQALAICRQNGHRVGEGQALTGLFTTCYHQNDLARAATYARESLAVSRDVGDRLGVAIAYHNLGFLAASGGNHREATEHYRQALAVYGTMNADATRQSNTHRYLAESLLTLRDTQAACEQVYQAIQIMPEAAYPQRAPDLLLTAARLLLQLQEKPLATVTLHHLQQQSLLPDNLEPPLSDLLEDSNTSEPVAMPSIEEALRAVEKYLAHLSFS